jgi:(2Fe-2S) ferredoxin
MERGQAGPKFWTREEKPESPSYDGGGGIVPNFERHVFVCTNRRDPSAPRPSCDPESKAELAAALSQKAAACGLKGRVRINRSGCLDQCEHGPTVVVYPEAVWYGNVTLADVDEIVERHLIGGEPVERLRLKSGCVNTASCEHRK